MKIDCNQYLNHQKLLSAGYLIDNQWLSETEASLRSSLKVTNPATKETLATLPYCAEKETHAAIESSLLAFKKWSLTLAEERSHFLRKWASLMKENQSDLATIMTLEQGKPIKESLGEVVYAASFLEWFAEEAKRTYGEIIPPHKHNARIVVEKQPVGVVGVITPWNFPLAMITRKIGPAIAAGCTAVVKPAEETPLCAIALMNLAILAGAPAGLINVVFGDYEKIGNVLTTHPIVKKISFTGSTEVGKLLLRQSSTTLKRISLELGGNAPFIVFKDADLNRAVDAALICKYRNTGQTCVCANRLYVEEAIYDSFCELLKSKVEKLKVGNGLDETTEQGPLINEEAFKKVNQHLEDAIQNGAKIICGGSELKNDLAGRFFEPTIVKDVNEKCLINQQETFGPLAPIIRFKSEEEVIELANRTPFGLAGYFFTKELSKAWRVAEALEVGMVGINEGVISTAAIPFGGVKESGLGREGSHLGIDEYLNVKYILMGI